MASRIWTIIRAFWRIIAQEVQMLFRELLIGVTEFFRDPDIWKYLTDTALPELLAKHPPNHTLRAWVVGCSTGEEAYSLAIAFMEALGPGEEPNLQIFASDISPEAIMLQRRILPLFHYSLRPNGLLMLGRSETVVRLNHLFAPMKPKLRLYRNKPHESIRNADFLLKLFPPLSTRSKEPSVAIPHTPEVNNTNNLQSAADHVLLQVYSPAAVVLNADADIVYISGRTSKYWELTGLSIQTGSGICHSGEKNIRLQPVRITSRRFIGISRKLSD